ncbi:MAG TPA: PEP-CTERM sorting domain-containing protein [Bacillota bacterium]|nr:PEP-CTERM sorting domain-containing protein [Bacillota bacterium]
MKTQQLRNGIFALAVCLGTFSAYPGRTAPILQTQFSGARNTVGYDAIGQSFTAADSKISIGVHLETASHLYPSANEFRYDLLAGEGLSGDLLGSCTFTLPEVYDSWADADFSFLDLSVGSKYTVRIVSSDPDWVIYDNIWAASQSGYPIPGRVDYAGGMEIFSGEFAPYMDLQFRVMPVPEPTAGTLLLLGAAGLVVRRSRNRLR